MASTKEKDEKSKEEPKRKRIPVGTRLARYKGQLLYAQLKSKDDE